MSQLLRVLGVSTILMSVLIAVSREDGFSNRSSS